MPSENQKELTGQLYFALGRLTSCLERGDDVSDLTEDIKNLLEAGADPAPLISLQQVINKCLGSMSQELEPSGKDQDYLQLKPFPESAEAGDEHEFEIAPGVKMVMCWIPPGEFLMGSPEDEKNRHNDEMQHRVTITRGFWLAKTPTTQDQWQVLMGSNPSNFEGGDLPVEAVSWDDICRDESTGGGFLGELNKRVPIGGRFQLPTEAQWEHACRAGTPGAYAGDLDEMAWHNGNSDEQTHPVGQKKPNAWGLHDMHGNVWEWCADLFGDYPEGAATDPKGTNKGFYRVFRGGSWFSDGMYCRSAFRGSGTPFASNFLVGFRVAAIPARTRRATGVA